jgi:carboxypeptidase family protein
MLRFCLGVVAIILSISVGPLTTKSHAEEQVFAATGIVVDRSGASIPEAEVVFEGHSCALVSHTDVGGSVNVSLPAGTYVVTVLARGFFTTKLSNFTVVDSSANAFRIVLQIDQSQLQAGSDLGESGRLRPITPSEYPYTDAVQPTINGCRACVSRPFCGNTISSLPINTKRWFEIPLPSPSSIRSANKSNPKSIVRLLRAIGHKLRL